MRRKIKTIFMIVAILFTFCFACKSNSGVETGTNQNQDPNPTESLTPPNLRQGFYKDVFIDAGVALTKIPSLTATERLNLSTEFISAEDAGMQNRLIVGSSDDLNGVLLYPDGEPRFRALYTNGGSSVTHGNSLGDDGRETVRTFYYNGGCYVGSCAGSALFSLSRETLYDMDSYYQIWPGRVVRIPVQDIYPEHDIPQDSPLLQYHHFGNDSHIGQIAFIFGNFARTDADYPSETEMLLRYDYPTESMHGEVSSWAYKRAAETGRGVVIGCHPEYYTEGEQLLLLQAMFLYALDGMGDLQEKGVLENNVLRVMDKSTTENNPAFTKIGDKQYHHFRCDVPSELTGLTIRLDGDDAYHLNVFVNHGDFAFQNDHDHGDISVESDKTIQISNPAAGSWYVSVECFSTVQATLKDWGYEYTGMMGVLNGVAYSIVAEWN